MTHWWFLEGHKTKTAPCSRKSRTLWVVECTTGQCTGIFFVSDTGTRIESSEYIVIYNNW